MQYMSIIFFTYLSMFFCSNPQNKAKEIKIDSETKNACLQKHLKFELTSNAYHLFSG